MNEKKDRLEHEKRENERGPFKNGGGGPGDPKYTLFPKPKPLPTFYPYLSFRNMCSILANAHIFVKRFIEKKGGFRGIRGIFFAETKCGGRCVCWPAGCLAGRRLSPSFVWASRTSRWLSLGGDGKASRKAREVAAGQRLSPYCGQASANRFCRMYWPATRPYVPLFS
jgi:hypothetical protein